MRMIVLLTAGLLATSAMAKDPEQVAQPSTPSTTSEAGKDKPKEGDKTSAKDPAAPTKTPDVTKDKAKAARTEKTSAKDHGASDAAYGRRVAAEIRRHIPKSSTLAPGSVDVTFTIDASGRVASHTVKRSSNPELTARVEKMLAAVKAPPPPGGSYFAHQKFNFH